MKHYDIAIIGGGPAGYFAAIKLLEKNESLNILLLEKTEIPLQKLLISGSGACNFTHTGSIEDFLTKYGKNASFLRNAFYKYFNDDFINFLEDNGITTLCRDDGKYFPKSMEAKDIKELFLGCTKKVVTKLGSEVENIIKEDYFILTTKNKKIFTSEKVLIATGGKSIPKTGSTGDGQTFAKNFGHTIVTMKPSLAAIYCTKTNLQNFSGISFRNARIHHKKNEYVGSLLITHKGFSGPVVIDNSRNFNIGDSIKISFISDKKEHFKQKLRQKQNEALGIVLKDFEVPKKLIQHFCDTIKLDTTKKICEISNKLLDSLSDLLTSYPITITGIEGFESCMCTTGGISLKEVNPKSLESRLVNGLFFLGEVLNIDGDSGGYNLQAIWSTAALFASNF